MFTITICHHTESTTITLIDEYQGTIDGLAARLAACRAAIEPRPATATEPIPVTAPAAVPCVSPRSPSPALTLRMRVCVTSAWQGSWTTHKHVGRGTIAWGRGNGDTGTQLDGETGTRFSLPSRPARQQEWFGQAECLLHPESFHGRDERRGAKPVGLPAPGNWSSSRSNSELDVARRPWPGAGPEGGMN